MTNAPIARAQIEEDYAKKILNLARKSLGSLETGTLRMSLDVVRAELESTGKSHHAIAGQMKQELEEPLGAVAGGLKERRKIIQTGIEKLLTTKTKQTHTVNKARDRYEQDCLKIKGYLAQGHMVMGQEERKNKAKLEKTQIQMSTTSQEYEQSVKVLEETTGRWNREWKAACDVRKTDYRPTRRRTDRRQKFQDLEEERLDFTKSSLWSFANISSTVCVSDDASCEKIRLSLEDCDVEKDISGFIKDQGTGQEIPDPPKYINFCRGDIPDNISETSEEEAYSVAQFQRAMNPAFRTSSPQPSTYSSHHDPTAGLAQQMGADGRRSMASDRLPSESPVPMPALRQSGQSGQAPHQQTDHIRQSSQSLYQQNDPFRQSGSSQQYSPAEPLRQSTSSQHYVANEPLRQSASSQQYVANEPRRPSQPAVQAANPYADIPKVPHNEYPMEGMTQFCRLGPPSDRSSIPSPTRPDSHDDSHSEYSNPTSMSSFEPTSGHASPTKDFNGSALSSSSDMSTVKEKKSGFFQNRSPFRRKSKHEKDSPPLGSNNVTPTQRTTWTAPAAVPRPATSASPARPFGRGNEHKNVAFNRRPSPSPEPDRADPRANFQLNIGNNVFDVASPDARKRPQPQKQASGDDLDPIAQALAELKGVTKQASTRVSADRYAGISTPRPTASPRPGAGRASPLPMNQDFRAAQRGTPPPSYDQQPVSRLGAPQPAFTSKQMQASTAAFLAQKRDVFGSGHTRGQSTSAIPQQQRPAAGNRGAPVPRATSPAPMRSTSPRPYISSPGHGHPAQQQGQYRAASPNPQQFTASQRPRAQSNSPIKPTQNYAGNYNMPRSSSPNPMAQSQARPQSRGNGYGNPNGRPQSAMSHDHSVNSLVLAPADAAQSPQQRGNSGARMRPTSQFYGADGGWAAAAAASPTSTGAGPVARSRAQSQAGNRPVTKDGRPILNYCEYWYLLCFHVAIY